jgi:hypothetical protein
MSQFSPDFLLALQARAARASLGPSSMRRPGNRGVIASGREFLCSIVLGKFGVASPKQFRQELDRATNDLAGAFPRSARHWGLARKGLHIFLRELYTVYLREAHHLDRAGAFFEVPRDSLSGRDLWEGSKRALPRWQTGRGLNPATGDLYQQVADDLASVHGVARVHLDALWWGKRTELSGAYNRLGPTGAGVIMSRRG